MFNKNGEKPLARFFKKHFNNIHYTAYGGRLLNKGCYHLNKRIIAADSDDERYSLIQNLLFPAHTEAYLKYLMGQSIAIAISDQIQKLTNNPGQIPGQGIFPSKNLHEWFRYHLEETERLRSQELYDQTEVSDEDLLLILCAAETMKPELFYSEETLRDSIELKTFMKRCVRRGRGFNLEYIAERLDITISAAKCRNIFSNREMGKLLQLNDSSIANLLTGNATPTELGAVARSARFLTRSIRELKELRRDSEEEYIAAAADGRLNGSLANQEEIAEELKKAVAKHTRLSAKKSRGK